MIFSFLSRGNEAVQEWQIELTMPLYLLVLNVRNGGMIQKITLNYVFLATPIPYV